VWVGLKWSENTCAAGASGGFTWMTAAGECFAGGLKIQVGEDSKSVPCRKD